VSVVSDKLFIIVQAAYISEDFTGYNKLDDERQRCCISRVPTVLDELFRRTLQADGAIDAGDTPAFVDGC
jgi:hypothetical protein